MFLAIFHLLISNMIDVLLWASNMKANPTAKRQRHLMHASQCACAGVVVPHVASVLEAPQPRRPLQRLGIGSRAGGKVLMGIFG